MLLIAADMLRRHKQLSMLVVAIRDLPELEGVFGHAAAKQVVGIAARKLGSLTRNSRAIRTAPTLFTILFPGWESRQAIDAVRSALGTPCCIELEVDGQGVVLLPELAAHTVGRETLSMRDVYDDLCRAASPNDPRHPHRHSRKHRAMERHAGREEARRAPSRSESHAHPLALHPRMVAYPPMPPTMPVQLGAR